MYYSDQRTHLGGPPQSVRLARVGTPGSGAVSKGPEGAGRRVVVAGRECEFVPGVLVNIWLTFFLLVGYKQL